MNQILITEKNNPNKGKKVKEQKVKERAPKTPGDTKGITRFFAILILIFGLALSADGAYAFVKNVEAEKNNKEPVVEVLKTGAKATVTITCENGIQAVSFAWNDSNSTVVQGRGNTEVQQELQIPSGENNKLNITVNDSNGKTSKYVKTLNRDSEDVTEPVISIEGVNSNIKITVTDDTAIDYITYRYGDTQEVTVSATEEGQTTIEETIPAVSGEETLVVEAVDKAQNVATKEQKIKGIKRPTIEVTVDESDPSYIIIKASDEDGLRMISYSINGQEYKTDPNTSLNSKTFEYRQKVEAGDNQIVVHAYNINEQVTEYTGQYSY